jgi:hypothetical protein
LLAGWPDQRAKTVQPHFAKKPRRPSFLKPQPPAAPEEEPPLQVDPLPSDLEPPKRRSLQLNLDPLPPPDEPLLKQRRSTDGSTKDISNLLDHHRSLQDALTADLTGMATQLKLNSLHFQDSLRKDRALVEGVENSMEGNLGTMQGQSGRLSAVRKKGRWTTCYVVGAVATVAAAWFFMFALMRSVSLVEVLSDADLNGQNHVALHWAPFCHLSLFPYRWPISFWPCIRVQVCAIFGTATTYDEERKAKVGRVELDLGAGREAVDVVTIAPCFGGTFTGCDLRARRSPQRLQTGTMWCRERLTTFWPLHSMSNWPATLRKRSCQFRPTEALRAKA